MYEISVKKIKSVDRIVMVLNKGVLLFDAYKGVNRLTKDEKLTIEKIMPEIPLALPEDI